MPLPAAPVRRLGVNVVATVLVATSACSPTADSSSSAESEPRPALAAEESGRSGAAGAEPGGDGGADRLVARNQSPGLKQLSGDTVRAPSATDE